MAGHGLRVPGVRHPLPRRATLPRLPAVLQTCWSRRVLPTLRGTRRRRRSHRMSKGGATYFTLSPDLYLSTERRVPPRTPPPKRDGYDGALSDPALTGGPHLSIKVGHSGLSKALARDESIRVVHERSVHGQQEPQPQTAEQVAAQPVGWPMGTWIHPRWADREHESLADGQQCHQEVSLVAWTCRSHLAVGAKREN
jgi:hypothetical protein